MKKISLIFIAVILCCSCVKEMEENDLVKAVSDKEFTYETKAGEVTVTGKQLLQQLIRAQSDKLYMLQSQLVHKDGTWRLLLSAEDAESLGISSELYLAFVEGVEELNRK